MAAEAELRGYKKVGSEAGQKFRFNWNECHGNSLLGLNGIRISRVQRPLPYLNPSSLDKFLLLLQTSSSFFDGQPNRTCTRSGLLLPSQTGYQSVRQALSSRSTVCYHTENQSRYDTLTVLTSVVTPPHNPIYSTSAISHPSNLHLLHLSHQLHSLLLTSTTSPSTSLRSEVDAATLSPCRLDQSRS